MKPCRGFTLLELLVVLVIIGIILSFAVLSVGDGGLEQQAEEETRRLAALMDLAAEQAILESRELGMVFLPSGYRFVTHVVEAWQEINDDTLLRPRTLPEGLHIELFLEALPVELNRRQQGVLTPHLILFSSGERTPFRLTIESDSHPAPLQLSGELFGKVKVSPVPQP